MDDHHLIEKGFRFLSRLLIQSVFLGLISVPKCLGQEKIAFWADWEGNLEIYTINSDGSELKNISNYPSEDANPVISPSGDRIAFYSKRDGNGEVYVMDMNGKNLRNITNHPSHDFNPSWSPDGDSLVFQSYRNGDSQIYKISIITGESVNISNNTFHDRNPDWSVLNKIVFVSTRNGSKDIYVMESNGSDQRLLYSNKQIDLFNPKWSSDGKLIVFHSSFYDFDNERGAIYKGTFDGQKPIKLSDDYSYNYNPFFYSNDQYIYYNTLNELDSIRLILMRVDGSHKEILR